MRFYPQYKHDDVLNMLAKDFERMYKAMAKVRAKEKLFLFDVVAYPRMEDKARDRLHREVYRQSETKEERAAQAVTSDQLTALPSITKETVEKWRTQSKLRSTSTPKKPKQT
jgi:benzoyl-CoA reductase/2-hydroxyglutaryl-CoA dehydratase subunit BcrC/BadD/HgdB